MRLYDCALRKKVDVVIDDNIPCHRGSREPLYAQHKGNEMYILLLEKAFAKFAGGYANLVGGYSVVAWMALTGCEEQQYWERSDDGKSWAKSLMEMDSRRERPRDFQNEFYTTPADDERDADKFFEFLAECDAQRFIMGAGIDGDEVERERADERVERAARARARAREGANRVSPRRARSRPSEPRTCPRCTRRRRRGRRADAAHRQIPRRKRPGFQHRAAESRPLRAPARFPGSLRILPRRHLFALTQALNLPLQ